MLVSQMGTVCMMLVLQNPVLSAGHSMQAELPLEVGVVQIDKVYREIHQYWMSVSLMCCVCCGSIQQAVAATVHIAG